MKILYGVPGEGMGHATRSKVIIAHLLQNGHDVRAVSSSRAYQFLDRHFPDRIQEIKGFHLAYKNAEVHKFKTFTSILKSGPKNLLENYHKYSQIKDSFHPDLIISDFESFTFFFAKLNNIPIISIDNMQVIDRCKLDIDIPKHEKDNHIITKNVIKVKIPKCDHYLITSFFSAPIMKQETSIIPSILRDEIINTVPSEENHILVYQTSTSQDNIIEILNNVSQEQFFVYGFNKDEVHGNVQLKSFSETEFIDNLASAKGVIANGGFSFLSEAIYLRKPICSVPIKNQFEQFVNAAYVQKLNFGRHFEDFSTDAVKAFIYDLDFFRENLKSGYNQNGNIETFQILDDLISNFEC